MSEAADSGAEERRVLGRCPETSGFTLETTLGQMAPPKSGHHLECYLNQVAFAGN